MSFESNPSKTMKHENMQQPETGFFDSLGMFPLPELGAEIEAEKKVVDLRTEEINQQQKLADEKNYPEISAWIKSCGQSDASQSRSTILLRQLSGIGEEIGIDENGIPRFDTNDYGDFLIQVNKKCARIFSAYFQALCLMTECTEGVDLDKNLTEENLIKLAVNFKRIPESESGSLHINQALTFLGYPAPGQPFRLCDAWITLNSLGANSTAAAMEVANYNKRLLAEFIISVEHTKFCISVIKNELNGLKNYVKDFLYKKPQWHARAWNQFQSCRKKIKEFGENGEHGGHIYHSPHWGMWKELSDEFP